MTRAADLIFWHRTMPGRHNKTSHRHVGTAVFFGLPLDQDVWNSWNPSDPSEFPPRACLVGANPLLLQTQKHNSPSLPEIRMNLVLHYPNSLLNLQGFQHARTIDWTQQARLAAYLFILWPPAVTSTCCVKILWFCRVQAWTVFRNSLAMKTTQRSDMNMAGGYIEMTQHIDAFRSF